MKFGSWLVLCAVLAASLLWGTHALPGLPAAAAASPDGAAIFAANCSKCHQANGAGGGPYPPLSGNPDVVAADTAPLIATVLNGRTGPITVLGQPYSGAMPSWRGTLSNADIAAVLTYIRGAWSNKAAAISEDQVAAAASVTAQSGADLFSAKCASCHAAAGQGSPTVPPLAGNPDVAAADPRAMIAIIVNGRSGPLTVGGKTYTGSMPTWKGQLSNADIAIVATYVRSAWGNAASPVSEQQVAAAGPAVSTAIGAAIYAKRCVACHAANGKGGGGGTFPALAGNAHVNAADATAMVTTISRGKGVMPAWKGQLSAGDIAAVATYVRSAWGNRGGPVAESEVSGIK
jgi:cbb3-type cytochrome c oxidase subunit III